MWGNRGRGVPGRAAPPVAARLRGVRRGGGGRRRRTRRASCSRWRRRSGARPSSPVRRWSRARVMRQSVRYCMGVWPSASRKVRAKAARDRPLIAASSGTDHGWAAFSWMACSAALRRGSAGARYQRGAVALRRKSLRMARTRRTSRSRSSTVCWPGSGVASSRESSAITSRSGIADRRLQGQDLGQRVEQPVADVAGEPVGAAQEHRRPRVVGVRVVRRAGPGTPPVQGSRCPARARCGGPVRRAPASRPRATSSTALPGSSSHSHPRPRTTVCTASWIEPASRSPHGGSATVRAKTAPPARARAR